MIQSDQSVNSPPESQRWIYMLVVWVAGVVLLNAALLLVAFKIEQIFKDFKVTLPGVTKVLVHLARAYRVPTGAKAIISGSVGVVVLVMVMGQIFSANVSRRTVWLSALFWLVLLSIVVGAILVPLFTLMAAISGRK